MYSRKAKLDRRNSIMTAVKKELKANNAFVAPELLKKLAASVDTSVFYGIEVIRDAEKAAEALRLTNHETAHSWAGDDGYKETCKAVVFGGIVVGEDYFYEYFDNGTSTGPEEHVADGKFDVNEPFAFLKHAEDWNSREGDCCNHDDEYDTIVIYSPERIYDEADYTAAKDAELGELCQLRDGKYNLPNALA